MGVEKDIVEKPYLWGRHDPAAERGETSSFSLSVGPIWKQRLLQAGYLQPTSIQIEAFQQLTNHKNNTCPTNNVIIASPTGSGKSLAYLLPLLTTMERNTNKQKNQKKKQQQQQHPPKRHNYWDTNKSSSSSSSSRLSSSVSLSPNG